MKKIKKSLIPLISLMSLVSINNIYAENHYITKVEGNYVGIVSVEKIKPAEPAKEPELDGVCKITLTNLQPRGVYYASIAVMQLFDSNGVYDIGNMISGNQTYANFDKITVSTSSTYNSGVIYNIGTAFNGYLGGHNYWMASNSNPAVITINLKESASLLKIGLSDLVSNSYSRGTKAGYFVNAYDCQNSLIFQKQVTANLSRTARQQGFVYFI